ncbi:MAG: DUF2490 domain-containing protein [Bacteroidetes bacterium]|nr:DUF2490 domain-containing protein [Bacteroidota bacterium]
MKRNKLKIILILLSLNTAAIAQKSDYGNWLIYFGNKAINKNWNWHHEIQYRNFNAIGDLEQLLIRTGIGYNLTENNNNILLGYAHINSNKYIANTEDKTSSNEHRIYQQFITKQNYGRFNWLHRYRVEERFINDDINVRFRYFLSLNIPFTKLTMQKGALYASLYNEIFLNAKAPVFDRNRIHGGIGYVVNKNFRFELGTMAQVQENNTRSQFQIIVFNNIPYKK